MKFSYFYSLYVLVVLYVISTSLALAGLDMYVDLTSLVSVFLPTLIAGIGAYLYAKDKFFPVVSITALTSGFLGSLVGVIATFSNVVDTQATLTGIALSALSIAYALIIILLIIPILLRNQAK